MIATLKKAFNFGSLENPEIIAGLLVKKQGTGPATTLVLTAKPTFTINNIDTLTSIEFTPEVVLTTNLNITSKENANITITQADMLSIAITDQVIDTANLPLIKKVFNFNNLTDQQVMNELMVKRVNDITTPNSYTLVLTSK